LNALLCGVPLAPALTVVKATLPLPVEDLTLITVELGNVVVVPLTLDGSAVSFGVVGSEPPPVCIVMGSKR
jgi:hypothetical protein